MAFLAFSEIHPDYYQIPIADRDELLAEETSASESDDLNDVLYKMTIILTKTIMVKGWRP